MPPRPGKVMLAFGHATPPPGPLRRYTSRTIADPRVLARVVEKVRAAGWADAVGEREEDLAALAAPVWGSRGELAAIVGVQGPAARLGPAARKQAPGVAPRGRVRALCATRLGARRACCGEVASPEPLVLSSQCASTSISSDASWTTACGRTTAPARAR